MDIDKDKVIIEEVMNRLEAKYSKELEAIKAILAQVPDLAAVLCKE